MEAMIHYQTHLWVVVASLYCNLFVYAHIACGLEVERVNIL